MENDDEFGFKSLAQSFAPEVKAERKAEALVPQPVPKAPVARVVPPPAIPEVSPREVAAAVPQQEVPPAPPIQNPVFDPEFQKAAGVTALAPALAGLGVAGGAAYGYYKGRKSVQDRMMGQTKAPEGLDTSRLDPEWQKILAQSERNRQAKQAEAVKNIQPVPQQVAPEPVAPKTPPAIQGTIQPSIAPEPNPAVEIPTIQQLTNEVVGTAPIEPPKTVAEVATETLEGKKKGRPTKEAQAKAMEGLTFRQDLGPGDNWLFNSFGGEGRKAILAQYNEGKPAGSYENAQQIFKRMQEEKLTPSRSELPRDIAKERGIAPPETNYGKLGKTAKMAGVAGLALTAAQLAQAKNATQARQTIGEALLPLLATPSNLAEGTLPPEVVNAMMAERQKLGSPYRSVPPR